MKNNKKAEEIVNEFIYKTKIISNDGEIATYLKKKLTELLNNQDVEQKNNYINLIKNLSKNDAYDKNGVLIETKKVFNILKNSSFNKSNIDIFFTSFDNKYNLISKDGEFYQLFNDIILKSFESKYNIEKNKFLDKISKLDKYDENGILIQTSLVINSLEINKKNKLKLK